LVVGGEVRKMVKKSGKASCAGPSCEPISCCKVEALVSVDERGQMVLPKEIREQANILAGDKLALVSWKRDGRVCCFTLIKADEFGDMVRGLLGPMMKKVMATGVAK
jgi:AbrB family looped-hinge helix DNA binding protein